MSVAFNPDDNPEPDGFPDPLADFRRPRLGDGPHNTLTEWFSEITQRAKAAREEAKREMTTFAVKESNRNAAKVDLSKTPGILRQYRKPLFEWSSFFFGAFVVIALLIVWQCASCSSRMANATGMDTVELPTEHFVYEGDLIIANNPLHRRWTNYNTFGVRENDIDFDYARFPAPDPATVHNLMVTCYTPSEGFPDTNQVCRGGTVRYWVDRALEDGLDGICAAGGQSPWYHEAKHSDPPIVLHIEGHGDYLCVDRMARRMPGVDIWRDDGVLHNTYHDVWMVTQ